MGYIAIAVTEADLARWEALCEAASPHAGIEQDQHRVVTADCLGLADFYHEEDAKFYVASRLAMPVLIAEVRRLRIHEDRVSRLRERIDALDEEVAGLTGRDAASE